MLTLGFHLTGQQLATRHKFEEKLNQITKAFKPQLLYNQYPLKAACCTLLNINQAKRLRLAP